MLDLKTLKQQIINKALNIGLIIFRCSLESGISKKSVSSTLTKVYLQNKLFLARQYVDEIAAVTGLPINNLASLDTIGTNQAVLNLAESLNILVQDELTGSLSNCGTLINTIIICTKIDKKLEAIVEPYIIDIPVLQDWQILDYLAYYCPGLSKAEYSDIYNAFNSNLYGIINELAKIQVFSEEIRSTAFKALKIEDMNIWFGEPELFDVIKAIFKQDFFKLKSILQYSNFILKQDPIGLSSLLLEESKKLLFCFYPTPLVNSLSNLTDNQIIAIKKNYPIYSKSCLLSLISFLSSVEYKIKSGLLDNINGLAAEYILCNVLNILKLK